MWCDVVWCDVMWCDVMWCDVMWCDVMWCDVLWCDVMWCDVMWCDVMWCDVLWWGERAGGGGGRRTGCIQNENPHFGEWWEKLDFKMISVLWRFSWLAFGGPKILVYIYIYITCMSKFLRKALRKSLRKPPHRIAAPLPRAWAARPATGTWCRTRIYRRHTGARRCDEVWKNETCIHI